MSSLNKQIQIEEIKWYIIHISRGIHMHGQRQTPTNNHTYVNTPNHGSYADIYVKTYS